MTDMVGTSLPIGESSEAIVEVVGICKPWPLLGLCFLSPLSPLKHPLCMVITRICGEKTARQKIFLRSILVVYLHNGYLKYLDFKMVKTFYELDVKRGHLWVATGNNIGAHKQIETHARVTGVWATYHLRLVLMFLSMHLHKCFAVYVSALSSQTTVQLLCLTLELIIATRLKMKSIKVDSS